MNTFRSLAPDEKTRGFTLIEMVIVVMVISIMATMGIMAAARAVKRGNETRAIQDVRSLMAAITNYYTTHRRYPPSTANGNINVLLNALRNDTRVQDDSCAKITADPWGNGYLYVDARNYSAAGAVDVEGDVYNPGSYDLYSLGVNGIGGGTSVPAGGLAFIEDPPSSGDWVPEPGNADNLRADVEQGKAVKGYGTKKLR